MDEERFIIRKAKPEDIPAIKKVYSDARAYMRETGNANQWIKGYPENCIEGDLSAGVLHVCEEKGSKGGEGIAAAFSLIPGEDPCYAYIEDGAWLNDYPYAAIHRIGVAAGYRGQGIAGFCVDYGFLLYGNIRIDTHADNAPMQAFLKKNGYRVCGKVYMADKTPRTAFQKTASLILASASPRRRELMSRLGRPFVSEASRVEETVPASVGAGDTAEYLSGIKAADIFNAHKGEEVTVIGSDTIVIKDGRIYGKPHSEKEAAEMLRILSGAVHEVRTGVTVISGKGGEAHPLRFSFTSVTEVEFYPLSDEEIDAYIKTGEPMDKAGAYGAQGFGSLLIKSISGDFYTVMGFPIARINRELNSRGL